MDALTPSQLNALAHIDDESRILMQVRKIGDPQMIERALLRLGHAVCGAQIAFADRPALVSEQAA